MIYQVLLQSSKNSLATGGDILAYNYVSGEHITGLSEGRPLIVRKPDADFSLPNFIHTLLMSSFATLRWGMDVLALEEAVKIDTIYAHGGIFKTPHIAQSVLAASLNLPITVGETAGEGGSWGMSILANYALGNSDLSLVEYLREKVFSDSRCITIKPSAKNTQIFNQFYKDYISGLMIEKTAVEVY